MGTLTPTLGIDHLKFCICYINELVQELLDSASFFYYDAQLGVNAITLEPLLAGNKYIFPYIPKFNINFFALPIFFHFDDQLSVNIVI